MAALPRTAAGKEPMIQIAVFHSKPYDHKYSYA